MSVKEAKRLAIMANDDRKVHFLIWLDRKIRQEFERNLNLRPK